MQVDLLLFDICSCRQTWSSATDNVLYQSTHCQLLQNCMKNPIWKGLQ